jgi:hypothetical protein
MLLHKTLLLFYPLREYLLLIPYYYSLDYVPLQHLSSSSLCILRGILLDQIRERELALTPSSQKSRDEFLGEAISHATSDIRPTRVDSVEDIGLDICRELMICCVRYG